ncbi:glutamate synthase subunit beta [Microbacterium endophyticum]|nr:glutamate synthase subunit beta [Microbacterium endophyticum]
MADPKGFLKVTEREVPARRPVPVRIMDWKEVYEPGDSAVLKRQAGRCMDCGVPFCHQGCPLGNLIPEWNDLTWRGEGRAAIERLHATNNFPEFTGRLCPAPCESSCVLGINQPAVTIKQVEVSIIDEAFSSGWVEPEPPERLTGKTVAVVGSGPAGLAAAQQLTRAGHTVAVYERDDRIGGLLRYGIPDFKMEKRHVEARLRQMRDEGTRFRAGVEIGKDIAWDELRARYDAVVIATGATVPRDLAIPGRDLAGVHFAMEYLVESNKAVAGDQVTNQISAEGKHVVVIGGGDTGADCIGTAHRQGALSVTNLAIGKQPPEARTEAHPWPTTPTIFEITSAHEEGGERVFLASTVEFLTNDVGEVRGLRVAETEYVDGRRVPKSGTERDIPADLVLIAMGFTGPDRPELESQLQTQFTSRGVLERADDYQTTAPGVFVAGDAGRGQSLIVWAIAEGRAAAASVDQYLMGETLLPAPVRPTDIAIGLQPA